MKNKDIEKLKAEKEKEEAFDKAAKLEKPDKREKDKPEKHEKDKHEKEKHEKEKHEKHEKPELDKKDIEKIEKHEKQEKDKHEKPEVDKKDVEKIEKHEKQEKDKHEKPEADKHFKPEKIETDKVAVIEKTSAFEKTPDGPGKISEVGGIQQPTGLALEARLSRLEAAVAAPKPAEKAIEGKQLEKKIETKEIKPEAKVEKFEKHETKEHPKIEKIEKFEKFEKIEHKDKHEKFEKHEPKEFKFEKIEQKDFTPEKPLAEGGKISETGPGPVETFTLAQAAEQIDTSGTVEERLARLEKAVFKMSHFIGVDLRPDLSAGALKREADLQEPAPPPAQGKDQPPPAGGKEGKKP